MKKNLLIICFVFAAFSASTQSFVSTSVVNTAQSAGTRDVIKWTMVHNMSEIQFNIYGAHFKASSGTSNAQQRLQEATILREHLNTASANYFIVAGDFNIYSSIFYDVQYR